MAANDRQVSKIWAAAREIGLEREQLYDLVEQVSGGRSISALTFAQAGAVIDALVRAGARAGTMSPPAKPHGRRPAANEVLLVTAEQRELIERLREQLGGDWLRDEYFEGACMRLLRRPRPRTAGEAARTIEMLKQRLAHDRSKAAAR